MKVLHLLSSNRKSGAENVVMQIINFFKDDVEMIYASPDGPIREDVEMQGYRFKPTPPLVFRKAREIRKVIFDCQPDIIHAHDVRASIFACLLSKNIPIISHLHCNFLSMRKLGLKSLGYYLCLPRISHAFVVTDSVLNDSYFSAALKRKCTVLHNVIARQSIESLLEKDVNTYSFDVAFLGRLCHQKDPCRWIRIIGLLKERIPNLKAAVIGDGVLRDEVEGLAAKLGLGENITFFGYVSNPYKIIAGTRVALFCSKFEGYPIAALEEMLLGVPIISTPTDGMVKLITNGINGFLEETDEGLANRLYQVLNNQQLLTDLSRGAIKIACSINDRQNYKKTIMETYNRSLELRNNHE